MRSLFYLFVGLLFFYSCQSKKTSQEKEYKSIEAIKTVKDTYSSTDWKLVWSDEFNYEGLPDSTKWSYNIGGHGWGNAEKQYYTEADTQNAIVGNGVLKLIALQQIKENSIYTSARVVTKNKGDWKYGKVEVRAKLPRGRGLWPAIWMLPTDWVYGDWPKSGEIDIMEHVGYNPDSIHQTVHTKSFNHIIGTQVGKATKYDSAFVYDYFHTYGMVWDENKIDFYIDGEKRHEFKNAGNGYAEWPFDQKFHIILNLAVGGDWGGKRGVDNSVFPAIFEVDYVRVYK